MEAETGVMLSKTKNAFQKLEEAKKDSRTFEGIVALELLASRTVREYISVGFKPPSVW